MYRNILFCIALSVLTGCASVAPPPPPPPEPVVMRAERAEALLQALFALGLDYRYGGSSRATGFDCSGLVAHVYRQAWGVRMPRTSLEQSRRGVPVAIEELQAG